MLRGTFSLLFYDNGNLSEILLGDVNGDEIINVIDIVNLVNFILAGVELSNEAAADYNQDGLVNVIDVVQIVNYILN